MKEQPIYHHPQDEEERDGKRRKRSQKKKVNMAWRILKIWGICLAVAAAILFLFLARKVGTPILAMYVDAEKLVHVKHSDYMPEEYLPTFSSHPIELNINRIKGLSEHFVYFNDDMFICRSIPREVFYRDEKPVHQARLHAVRPGKIGAIMPHIYLNCTEVINEHFDMHQVLKKDRDKWFSVRKNGIKTVMENAYCSQFKMFPGFKDEHLPVPILKSTMDTIWELNGERLDATCRHRFRDVRDVSQYVFRYWQLASGNFVPEKLSYLGAHYTITSDSRELDDLCRHVSSGDYRMMCLNDADGIHSQEEFLQAKQRLLEAFETLLPEKSSYEKQDGVTGERA